MRRFIMPGVAALLLTASLATPSSASSGDLSVQSPDCAKAALSFMAPEAANKSTHPACGACSVPICVGEEDGKTCGTAPGGLIKYCRPTGPLCQDGPPYGDFRCTCTTGIVP